eukprot:941316_1
MSALFDLASTSDDTALAARLIRAHCKPHARATGSLCAVIEAQTRAHAGRSAEAAGLVKEIEVKDLTNFVQSKLFSMITQNLQLGWAILDKLEHASAAAITGQTQPEPIPATGSTSHPGSECVSQPGSSPSTADSTSSHSVPALCVPNASDLEKAVRHVAQLGDFASVQRIYSIWMDKEPKLRLQIGPVAASLMNFSGKSLPSHLSAPTNPSAGELNTNFFALLNARSVTRFNAAFARLGTGGCPESQRELALATSLLMACRKQFANEKLLKILSRFTTLSHAPALIGSGVLADALARTFNARSLTESEVREAVTLARALMLSPVVRRSIQLAAQRRPNEHTKGSVARIQKPKFTGESAGMLPGRSAVKLRDKASSSGKSSVENTTTQPPILVSSALKSFIVLWESKLSLKPSEVRRFSNALKHFCSANKIELDNCAALAKQCVELGRVRFALGVLRSMSDLKFPPPSSVLLEVFRNAVKREDWVISAASVDCLASSQNCILSGLREVRGILAKDGVRDSMLEADPNVAGTLKIIDEAAATRIEDGSQAVDPIVSQTGPSEKPSESTHIHATLSEPSQSPKTE